MLLGGSEILTGGSEAMKAMRLVLFLLTVVTALGLEPAAHAGEYALGQLLVQHPWARASIGQAKAGAAYLVIVNRGEVVDRLVAVETPVARRAAVHIHLLEEGVLKERPVGAIEIAPGKPAVLRPGELHVMLFGLEAPLREGTRFPLTLIFEAAGGLEVEVYVTSPMATEGP